MAVDIIRAGLEEYINGQVNGLNQGEFDNLFSLVKKDPLEIQSASQRISDRQRSLAELSALIKRGAQELSDRLRALGISPPGEIVGASWFLKADQLLPTIISAPELGRKPVIHNVEDVELSPDELKKYSGFINRAIDSGGEITLAPDEQSGWVRMQMDCAGIRMGRVLDWFDWNNTRVLRSRILHFRVSEPSFSFTLANVRLVREQLGNLPAFDLAEDLLEKNPYQMMKFTTRTKNAMIRSGITNMADLLSGKKDKKGISDIRNLGFMGMNELVIQLAYMGILPKLGEN